MAHMNGTHESYDSCLVIYELGIRIGVPSGALALKTIATLALVMTFAWDYSSA